MKKAIIGAVVTVAAATVGYAASHGAPTITHCVAAAQGQLPDKTCTPGVVDPALTRADLCPHLGPSVVRSVPQSFKDSVRKAYNDQRPGEIDHLISLELGGSNDIKNLWPEDGKIPNAKDTQVENPLHAWVCAGSTPAIQTQRLHAAQQAIAKDWTTAARIITP